jgi:hypothetical protein
MRSRSAPTWCGCTAPRCRAPLWRWTPAAITGGHLQYPQGKWTPAAVTIEIDINSNHNGGEHLQQPQGGSVTATTTIEMDTCISRN